MSKVLSFKSMGAASTAKATSDMVGLGCETLDGLVGISKSSGGKSSGGKSESPSDPERLSGVTGCGVLPGAPSMSCVPSSWSLGCFA